MKVCGFPLVICALVPCSLFRMPLRESSFVASNPAGKSKLTKRPAETDVPVTVGCAVSVRMALLPGALFTKCASTSPLCTRSHEVLVTFATVTLC